MKVISVYESVAQALGKLLADSALAAPRASDNYDGLRLAPHSLTANTAGSS
jgi:hypothetical protein